MALTRHKPLSVQAVVKLLERDDEGNALYRWRRCSREGQWLEPARQGSAQELSEDLPASLPEVCLLLSGTEVVAQQVSYQASERRHLARLIPYELEDDVTAELDDLHFALGTPRDGEVAVAYVDREWLGQQIDELEEAGLEVSHCISEPLLLPRAADGWTLRLEDEELQVHYGSCLGFTVESAMAAPALASLMDTAVLPQHLLLIADDQENLERLYELLPATLLDDLNELQIETRLARNWDSLALDHYEAVNMRQGSFARQLPWRKWWYEWRMVAAVAGLAFFAYVGVNAAQIDQANRETAELRQQIEAAFRQVIPQGVMANPESQLQNRLREYQGSSGGSSVVELVATVGPLIAAEDKITLRRLTYNDQRSEMQLTLEASSNSEILALSDALNEKGLRATPQNMSRVGDRQQANLTITRAMP